MAKAPARDDVTPAPSDAAPHEAPPTREQIAAELLASYTRNMESAAPRTMEELRMIQALAAPPAK